MKSSLFKWLVMGVLIRVVIMPITLHPDLWGHSFTAYFFAYKGIFNIYEYLLSLPESYPLVANFGVSDIFIYPPLTYFTLGIFKVLTKPFVDPEFLPWLMENLSNLHTRQDLPLILFFYKLPYLFVDIAVGYLLTMVFPKTEQKLQVFKLWMVNPVTIYATFMMGQFDIIPVFFTVLALVLHSRKKFTLSILALGVGASFKMYPALLIIPAALYFSDKIKARIKYILIGLLPFVLSILPFIGSQAFRQMVLFTPKSQKMLFMQFPVTGAESLYPFIIGLFLIILVAYYKKYKFDLNDYFLVTMLLMFSVTHYHPQWFLWITPFLLLNLLRDKYSDWLIVLIFTTCWLILVFSFDPSLNYGLFRVVAPVLAEARVGLFDIVAKYTDANMVKSLVRSVFAGTALFYSLKLAHK